MNKDQPESLLYQGVDCIGVSQAVFIILLFFIYNLPYHQRPIDGPNNISEGEIEGHVERQRETIERSRRQVKSQREN